MTVASYAVSFTFGESVEFSSEREKIQTLLENQGYCIEKVEESRVYFKPSKIYPMNEGVFVRFDRFSLVELTDVQKDKFGYFVWLPRVINF